jgi:hypothetical protein
MVSNDLLSKSPSVLLQETVRAICVPNKPGNTIPGKSTGLGLLGTVTDSLIAASVRDS